MTIQRETSGSATSRLRSQLGSLPSAERRVAAVILADPAKTLRDSAATLAARAGSSPATVVRLAHRLAYSGFPELKIALAGEIGVTDRPGPVTDGWAIAMERDADAIREAARVLDAHALGAAADAIANGGETFFCGVGSSSGFAALCALRFSAIGVRASSAADPLTQRLHAEALRVGDVCVAISHTGESTETIDALHAARAARSYAIAVTSFAGSPITAQADATLVCTSQTAPATREGLFANPVALLSVLGALHAEVSARVSSREEIRARVQQRHTR
jgi:DNA-binding MurR/RpiR family transcriptional regulator